MKVNGSFQYIAREIRGELMHRDVFNFRHELTRQNHAFSNSLGLLILEKATLHALRYDGVYQEFVINDKDDI